MRVTVKQATTWLNALDNLVARERQFRHFTQVEDHSYKWEREAIFRLRGLLMGMGAPIDDDEPESDR